MKKGKIWPARIRLTILLTILLSIGVLLISGFPVFAGTDYSTIRVKISLGDKAKNTSYITTLNITVNGSYCIREKPGVSVGGKTYTVKVSGSAVALYDGSANLYSGSSFTLSPANADLANTIKLYNYHYNASLSYLGDMKFRAYARVVSGSTKYYIMAINHVNIEQYLYGVVPHEMSNSFPMEALKAQAVCARGYAIKQMNAGATYDVSDTSGDQVYKGYNPVNNNAISAVDATKKQVVTYNGSIVCTYFAASNGGATEVTSNVWSAVTPPPYQVVKPDPYDLRNPSTPRENKDFTCAVSDNTKNPDENDALINLIKANYIMPKLNADGKVNKDGEEISVSSEFTWKQIISMSGKVPESHLKFAKYNCACTHVDTLIMKVKVGTYEKTAEDTYTPQDVEYTISFAAEKLEDWGIFTKTSLRVYFINPIKDTAGNITGYSLLHSRYGHGIGLSQRGAQQMAKEGLNYKQILDFYFPNTTLKEAQINAPVYADPDPAVTDPAITGIGQVTSSTLNVRSGPGTSYSILNQLTKGNTVDVVKSCYTSDWHQIWYNNNIGYVHKNYISLFTAVPTTVAADTVEIKKTPAATAETLASVKKGDSLGVYTYSGDYALVSYNGAIGYVLKSAFSAQTKPATPPASTKPAVVGIAKIKVSKAYLYSGASTGNSKVAGLTRNKLVDVVKKNIQTGWHQVWYNNKPAYVQSKYVTYSTGTQSTVLAQSAALKKSASSSAATLATLKKGATFNIYGYSGSYMYSNYGGITGYISKNALKPTVTGYAYVITSVSRVRSKASSSSASLAALKKNAVVEVVNQNYNASWMQVAYSGKLGYVYKKSFKLFDTQSAAVNATTLKLRSTASTSARALKTMSKGNTVAVLARGSVWCRIYYSGTAGYVQTKYLKF